MRSVKKCTIRNMKCGTWFVQYFENWIFPLIQNQPSVEILDVTDVMIDDMEGEIEGEQIEDDSININLELNIDI